MIFENADLAALEFQVAASDRPRPAANRYAQRAWKYMNIEQRIEHRLRRIRLDDGSYGAYGEFGEGPEK